MQLTTSQIIKLARAKILEQTGEIVSDETLLIYANLTYQDLMRKTFTSDKVKTVTLAFTGGSVAVPLDFGTLYGSGQDVAGNVFEEVSIEDFDNKTLDEMITVENGTIKVYPTTTANLTVKYYPQFSELTIVPSTTPDINDYFHELIVYGVVARAYEDLQDESLSIYYSDKYKKELAERLSTQSNYEENNQRGGQMFTYQRLI